MKINVKYYLYQNQQIKLTQKHKKNKIKNLFKAQKL